VLEIITFTGVDENTDLEEVRKIAARHPEAEFAVLAGTQTGWGNPIFPPLDVIRKLRDLEGVRTAVHLCGIYARMAAGETDAGETDNPHSLNILCNGFGRVQINLHGDMANPNRVRVSARSVESFAERTGTGSVILQHRGPWADIPLDHPRVEYLFDLSEGAGIESFELWPHPPQGRRAGYAGGIGPHNIRRAMEFVNEHTHAQLWLDMERNVRTPDYLMDLGKVREVCGLALDGRKR
jgi:hypothetical protein